MSEQTRQLRNIAIVLILAGIVYAVPGGSATGEGIYNILVVVMFAALGFFAYRLYMEHRTTLEDMPEDQRRLLYGSVTLAAVTLLATGRMWGSSGALILIWFALLGLAAAGLASFARRRREY